MDLGIHLYGFLGPGWILDRKEILGEPVKCLYSTEMVVDLGYTFMVSLGQGESWKEILGEPVKWLYSTGMVVDLGGPWIYLYGFLGPGWILEGNSW